MTASRDELAPVHVVAKGRRKQPQPVAALAEDGVGLLENSDPATTVIRVDGDVAPLEQDLHPVVEPATMIGAYRSHRVDVLPRSRAPQARSTDSATAMHCGSVKAHGRVDADPAMRRSSIAAMPALVAGILTIMFGARALNPRPV